MGLVTIALRLDFLQIYPVRIRLRRRARSKEALGRPAYETTPPPIAGAVVIARLYREQPNSEFLLDYFFGNRIISLAL